MATLGRNVLLHEGGPVLVVMNAKTSDRELAAEQREFMASALRYIANEDAFEALAFMPQIDIMLFETPAVVEKLLAGRESSDLLLALGLHDPSSTLKRLLGHSDLTEYYRSLSADDVHKLSSGPQASELLAAVDRLVGSAAASRAA